MKVIRGRFFDLIRIGPSGKLILGYDDNGDPIPFTYGRHMWSRWYPGVPYPTYRRVLRGGTYRVATQ